MKVGYYEFMGSFTYRFSERKAIQAAISQRPFRSSTWQWVEIEWGQPHLGKDWSSTQ